MKSFSNGPIYNKIYTYIYIDSTFLYLKLYKTSHSMKREENANRNKKTQTEIRKKLRNLSLWIRKKDIYIPKSLLSKTHTKKERKVRKIRKK